MLEDEALKNIKQNKPDKNRASCMTPVPWSSKTGKTKLQLLEVRQAITSHVAEGLERNVICSQRSANALLLWESLIHDSERSVAA